MFVTILFSLVPDGQLYRQCLLGTSCHETTILAGFFELLVYKFICIHAHMSDVKPLESYQPWKIYCVESSLKYVRNVPSPN